jgi:hypothetical protein
MKIKKFNYSHIEDYVIISNIILRNHKGQYLTLPFTIIGIHKPNKKLKDYILPFIPNEN